MKFFFDELQIGTLDAERAELVIAVMPALRREGEFLRWRPGSALASASAQIQAAAQALRAQGHISGWRDERYRCEVPVADPCREFGSELFTLERAAFRFFGLMSRAVHINGLRADGHVWCGRRALHKPIDPGRLDNLAAGGLGAGEDPLDCARRELFEEAGVPLALATGLRAQGALRMTRPEPQGLHDEVLHVYELRLPDDFVPVNQDGEVSEFLLLSPAELARRLPEFTPDAAAVLRRLL